MFEQEWVQTKIVVVVVSETVNFARAASYNPQRVEL